MSHLELRVVDSEGKGSSGGHGLSLGLRLGQCGCFNC